MDDENDLETSQWMEWYEQKHEDQRQGANDRFRSIFDLPAQPQPGYDEP